MAVDSVNIGDKRVWFTAYNPADALALLYCRYFTTRVKELLDNTPAEVAHAWLREHVPGAEELLEKIEQGWQLERDVDIGRFPISPGASRAEMLIVTALEKEKVRQQGLTEETSS